MVDRCKNCGEKIIKFPIWKGQEKGEPFNWDKVIWINLFKMDWYSIALILVIVAMILGYKADIKKCDDAINNPCEFCERSNCCQVDWGKVNPGELITRRGVVIKEIPEFNTTVKYE